MLGISWHGSELILLGYLQNVPPLIGAIPATVHRYTAHFWSLAVEEQFYLLWPCMMFYIRDRKKLMITALSLATLAPILRIAILHSHGLSREMCLELTLCRMDSLLIGGALALAVRGPERSSILKSAPIVFLPLLVLCTGLDLWLTGGTLDLRRGDFFLSVGFTLLAISCASLIACALRPGSVTDRVFKNRVLGWFGRYSYGIYVLHFIFANTFRIGLYPRLILEERFHSRILAVALGGFPTLAITLVCAWLSYRFYETPFLRLKSYFGRPSSHAVRQPSQIYNSTADE
jgi:peptidoglycan/LPS O-acetylase OafA/YrhL